MLFSRLFQVIVNHMSNNNCKNHWTRALFSVANQEESHPSLVLLNTRSELDLIIIVACKSTLEFILS